MEKDIYFLVFSNALTMVDTPICYKTNYFSKNYDLAEESTIEIDNLFYPMGFISIS